jgi:spore germination protein KA
MNKRGIDMFRALGRFLKQTTSTDESPYEDQTELLKANLGTNIQIIKKTMGNSSDLVLREIDIGKEQSVRAGIAFYHPLSDAIYGILG